MKRILILFFLFVNILFCFSDENFLLKKIPSNYNGYRTFDYFLIEKKLSDSGDYSRNHNITRYKAAFYLYEIYRNGLRKNIDFLPVHLEAYEFMINDFNYELVFLYGDKIISIIKEEIEIYRKEKKIIKHKYINENNDNMVLKTMLINTDYQNNIVTSGKFGIEYKYTFGTDVDVFSSNNKDKDYSSYLNTVINTNFNSFKTYNSFLWNDDYTEQNSKIKLKIFNKFRDFSFFNNINRKNSILSNSGYYFDSIKSFNIMDLNIDIKGSTKKNNSDDINYFYTEWRSKSTKIDINSDISRGVSGFAYTYLKKDYQKNFSYNENITEYKGYLKKEISGQYIDGMILNFYVKNKEYENNIDKRKDGKIESWRLKIDLPYNISYYTIDLGVTKRDVTSEDKDHVDAELSEFRFSRIWFDRLRSDFILAYNYKDYNALDNVLDGFNVDSYDYMKKYWEISFVHYFKFLSSIDISLFVGSEDNPVNNAQFPCFDFVYRSVDIHINDIVLEYSTLQKSHNLHKNLNSKLFNIGVFYEFYW
ncbi:MAG: hypothetical protein M0R46_01165 [Candidatus Muirbacterium halophilum]|nr:hypothetical protein [Candidatus Muirbacterium halophilum]MCK9474505.1 hypothetical protein [Candidatus Muirbacterium halophilum]